ncbi:hypothetical protein SAMN05216360_110209 [Methylobacterium phyllostachyos]|uniref:Type III restriction enzyme, res subunit n=1 Tax=Methylobacterium phyllostachyos TaxID=582672 RepID=A0A1H0DKZ8_9HYPH|nr:hypothetical protein SAMN05216360_110209 [Methylobacterium phyllostachyos]
MGGGKTDSTVRQVIRLVRNGENCILTQPTKALNKQTLLLFRRLAPDVSVELINSDAYPNGTVYQLLEHMKRPPDHSHVVLTTWESFVRLPKLFNQDQFHLRIDEIPKAYKSFSVIVPKSHRRLTDTIERFSRGSSYGEIIAQDRGTLRSIAENKVNDAVEELFQPFARVILDPKYKTYVNVSGYDALLRGNTDEPYLRVFSLLQPSFFVGFRSVSMVGARASETMLFKWFERCGVRFKDDDEITSGLRYREHTNGNLIDFHYLSETNWSLYAQERDPHLRELFVNGAISKLGREPFCWLDNIDFEKDSPLRLLPNATKLPHGSHGRNDFQHFNNVAILTAFNLPGPETQFLRDVAGISEPDQKIAHDYHSTMQTIGRISIRDPNNSCGKLVILPDRQNAEWQSGVFPGSRVHSLGLDQRKPKRPGPTKQYENSAERQRARRSRMKEEQDQLAEKFSLGAERINEAGFYKSCHKISNMSIRELVTTYQGSIVSHLSEGMSFPINMPIKNFGIYLKGLHKRRLGTKESNELIMPALCAPVANVDSQRGLENAIFGRHLYLDIDGGHLKYLQLSRILSHLEMIVYNSFNHTSESHRYRVVFLTDELLSPTIYKFIWRQIVQRIENAGYLHNNSCRPKGDRKLHGIDNKPSIVNLFYLPCQPKEGKGFFYHYTKNRSPLCINDWIEHAIPTRFDLDEDEELITVVDAVRDLANSSELIEKGMGRYRNFIHSIDPGTGKLGSSNKALFVLDKTLKRAGADYADRDIILTQAANESRSPIDRNKDKKRYMNKR